MSFKQTVAKFAQEYSNNSAALKFNVDTKWIREWMNNINEISTKKTQLERDLTEVTQASDN